MSAAAVSVLGLQVDSAPVKDATASLKDFSAASKTAATGADTFNKSGAEMDTRARAIAASAERLHITMKEAEARFNATNSQVKAGADGLGQYAKQAQQVANAHAAAMKAANDNSAGISGNTASLVRGVAVLSVYGAALHSAFTIAVGLLDMLKDKGPTVEQTFAEQNRLLGIIKDSYDRVSGAAKTWIDQSRDVTQVQLLQQELDLRQKLNQETARFLKNDALKLSVNGENGQPGYVVPDKLKAFEDAITRLKQSWDDGTANVAKFRDEVAQIILLSPALQKVGADLINKAGDASQFANSLKQVEEMLKLVRGEGISDEGKKRLGLPDAPKARTFDPFAQQVISVEKHIAAINADNAAVGKSVGEHERLRVEAQLYEAATQKGRTATAEQVAEIERLGKAAGAARQAFAQKAAQDQADFDLQTVFMSDTEKQIAAIQKRLHVDDWKAFTDDALSQQMRLTAGLKEVRDVGLDFTKSLASGLMQSKSAMEALHNAAGSLATKLADSALTDLFSGEWQKPSTGGSAAIDAKAIAAASAKKSKPENDNVGSERRQAA
jgi:hypothetical protein